MVKKGDTVRIRTDIIQNEVYNGWRINPHMTQYLGKTATVISVSQNNSIPYYNLNIDRGAAGWTDDMVEELNEDININDSSTSIQQLRIFEGDEDSCNIFLENIGSENIIDVMTHYNALIDGINYIVRYKTTRS